MPELWTVDKVLNWTVQHFSSKKISDPRLSAELLIAKVLNCSRVNLYIQFERILSLKEREQLKQFIERRNNHEPVQYILGETEFYGHRIKLNSSVLIPRPETELLVDEVLQYYQSSNKKKLKIFDIGTGSGCIAIALAKLLPDSEIWANEISVEALANAKENAILNGANIQFIAGNIFKAYQELPAKFDVVVSNPPYVALNDAKKLSAEVQNFEPYQALFSGETGLEFYTNLISIIPDILLEDGIVFLETGYDTAQPAENLFHEQGFHVQLKKDFNKIERILIIKRLTEIVT
jgi:release factor glutamine methyltransferase